MDDKSYPVPYYKHLHQPRSAHSPKEENALKEAGWTANRYEMLVQEFPKTLYNATGLTVTVGKYPEQGGPLDEEAARREEAEMNDRGYSSKAVARKIAAVERAPIIRAKNQELEERAEESRESNGRMDVIEERMDGMEGSIGEILALLKAGQSAKPKRPASRSKHRADEEKAG